MTFDIDGLDKVVVFRALYDRAQPQGCSHLSYVPGPLRAEEARMLFDASDGIFRFVKGRLLKVDLSGADLDAADYDRNNGPGAALAAIRMRYPGFPQRPS